MKFESQLLSVYGILSFVIVLVRANQWSSEYNVLQFENFGYSGYYDMVKELKNVDSDDCSCKVEPDGGYFSGVNAPINQEVSVHFRGPLVLNKFAFFTSDGFQLGDDNSGDWSRLSYYDAASSTAENVTFLTKAGTNSSCLGKALTYAGSDGLSQADKATVLAEDTLIGSNDEYVIFSNVSCEKSGYKKDCGVYRSGIPAYHGFYGDVKMFLFEFKMPNETTASKSISNYNMPAIWLLNAHIPRTAQYAMDVNCSCWRSGCGEFDIFEVLNTTDVSNLYSSIHDYQGTDDIETGMLVEGYIERDFEGTMVGGVVFDSKGLATVFMSNSTSFDQNITASEVNSWVKADGTIQTDLLESLAPVSNTKSSGGNQIGDSILSKIIMTAVALVCCLI